MNQIKRIIKNNYYYIIFVVVISLVFFVRFPYYIDAPGGIINVNDRIEVENAYKENGSFNLSYVSEYNANLITLLISLFNKDWEVIKQEDVLLDNETITDYNNRDKLLMEESISNAIFVAYTSANKSINIKSNSIKVAYLYEESESDIRVGDEILEVNGIKVSTKKEVKNILSKHNKGDILKIKVKNNNKVYNRTAKVIKYEDELIIGVMIVDVKGYDLTPSIKIKTNKKESGPSGGLMLALSIYNKITEEDITNNFIIVGTGTIDSEGNVGSIGGVDYKLKAAVKGNADLFIVPNGENYKDAMKLKKKNNYSIEIVGVSNFNEIVNYLKTK